MRTMSDLKVLSLNMTIPQMMFDDLFVIIMVPVGALQRLFAQFSLITQSRIAQPRPD
jgi:hypothetical protein